MEIDENIAGLGKDKDANGHEFDKKQSEIKPIAENIDMTPNSVNKDGSKEFLDHDINEIEKTANNYANQEHKKADNWEHKEDNV